MLVTKRTLVMESKTGMKSSPSNASYIWINRRMQKNLSG